MLDEMKQIFASKQGKELEDFFSSPSVVAGFTNSQLFFYTFSKDYKLHTDGEFARLCTDIKKYIGGETATELMSSLHRLRDEKVKQIKDNAPELLTHTSNISPAEMGNAILVVSLDGRLDTNDRQKKNRHCEMAKPSWQSHC